MDIKRMWSATVERNEIEQDRDQRRVLVKTFGSGNKASGFIWNMLGSILFLGTNGGFRDFL
jgi:hypothetical protein